MKGQKLSGRRKPRAGKDTGATVLPIDPEALLDAAAAATVAPVELKKKAGEVVFQQGDRAGALFFIKDGRVQLTVVSHQGREAVIAVLGPGDFFGEGCLAGQRVRLSSAVALMPSRIIRIDKDAMVQVLHDRPNFAKQFMAFLVSRNMQVEADLIDQLFHTAEKRLARVLLLLANFTHNGELRPIIPKVSQELLAARVGTTRSRINQFLNKFRKLGLVEYNGGEMKVHTSLLNVILHD